jgi:hypothetical protein
LSFSLDTLTTSEYNYYVSDHEFKRMWEFRECTYCFESLSKCCSLKCKAFLVVTWYELIIGVNYKVDNELIMKLHTFDSFLKWALILSIAVGGSAFPIAADISATGGRLQSESREKIEQSRRGGFIRVARGGVPVEWAWASGLGLRAPRSAILVEERLATATLAEGRWAGVFGIEGGGVAVGGKLGGESISGVNQKTKPIYTNMRPRISMW